MVNFETFLVKSLLPEAARNSSCLEDWTFWPDSTATQMFQLSWWITSPWRMANRMLSCIVNLGIIVIGLPSLVVFVLEIVAS